jgi:hypothetical protein
VISSIGSLGVHVHPAKAVPVTLMDNVSHFEDGSFSGTGAGDVLVAT